MPPSYSAAFLHASRLQYAMPSARLQYCFPPGSVLPSSRLQWAYCLLPGYNIAFFQATVLPSFRLQYCLLPGCNIAIFQATVLYASKLQCCLPPFLQATVRTVCHQATVLHYYMLPRYSMLAFLKATVLPSSRLQYCLPPGSNTCCIPPGYRCSISPDYSTA